MTLDLGRLLSHSLAISWRHRWLWFLGVFGGAAGGLNFGSGPATPFRSGRFQGAQLAQFLGDHLAWILGAIAAVLVISVIAFVVSCVAVPASIWAGLELDAGRPVGLGAAWREGRSRFWRYLRLALLKLAIGLVIAAVAGVLVLAGFAVYRAGGSATLVLLVLGGVFLLLALIVASILLRLALTWSDRLLVILELGVVDSIRTGWWLFKRSKVDTVVFGLVLYVVRLVIAVIIAIIAGLAAVPGLLMVAGYFATSQASTGLLIAGIVWIVVVGGGVELVGAGFLGAFSQVGYALAARDLTQSRGLQTAPA